MLVYFIVLSMQTALSATCWEDLPQNVTSESSFLSKEYLFSDSYTHVNYFSTCRPSRLEQRRCGQLAAFDEGCPRSLRPSSGSLPDERKGPLSHERKHVLISCPAWGKTALSRLQNATYTRSCTFDSATYDNCAHYDISTSSGAAYQSIGEAVRIVSLFSTDYCVLCF